MADKVPEDIDTEDPEVSEAEKRYFAASEVMKAERLVKLKDSLLDPDSELPETSVIEEIQALTEIQRDLDRNRDRPREERMAQMVSMAHRLIEKEYKEHHPEKPYDPKKGEQGYFYMTLAQRGLVPFPPKVPLAKRVGAGIAAPFRETAAIARDSVVATKGAIREIIKGPGK